MKRGENNHENTKRIHAVTSKTRTALQNNSQWPCQWSGTFDDVCLFECLCMGFLFVSFSLPSVSAALASRITASESSSGGFRETDLDLLAHSSGDRLLIGHVICYVLCLSRCHCIHMSVISCVCVGPSLCCYDDTTGHNSSADAANSPTPSSEPPAAPAVTAATTSTDVTAGTGSKSVSIHVDSFCLNVSIIIRALANIRMHITRIVIKS